MTKNIDFYRFFFGLVKIINVDMLRNLNTSPLIDIPKRPHCRAFRAYVRASHTQRSLSA